MREKEKMHLKLSCYNVRVKVFVDVVTKAEAKLGITVSEANTLLCSNPTGHHRNRA